MRIALKNSDNAFADFGGIFSKINAANIIFDSLVLSRSSLTSSALNLRDCSFSGM